MAASVPQCAAPAKSCGTPYGWRRGGRCPRCRDAHNKETSARRRMRNLPPKEQVDKLLRLLAEGMDLTEAARQAGIHPRTARAMAKDDARIATALAPEGAMPASKLSRQSDYLKRLLDCKGVAVHAAAAAGIAIASVNAWRKDPQFAAAEESLRGFISGREAKPRRKYRFARPEQFETYLDLLAEGIRPGEAARRSGLGPNAVHYRASRDEEFANRLSALRPRRLRPGRVKIEVDEAQVRAAWADHRRSLPDLAGGLGISVGVLRDRARGLGLPDRRKGR